MPTTPEYTVEDNTNYLPENSADLAAIVELQEGLSATNEKLDNHIAESKAFKQQYHKDIDRLENDTSKLEGRLDQHSIENQHEFTAIWKAINGANDAIDNKIGKEDLYTAEQMEEGIVPDEEVVDETAVSFGAVQKIVETVNGTISGVQDQVTSLAEGLEATNQSVAALDEKVSGNIEAAKAELSAVDTALSGAIDALTQTVADNDAASNARDTQLATTVKAVNDNLTAAVAAVSGSIPSVASGIVDTAITAAVATLATKDEVNEFKSTATAKYETLSGHIDNKYQELKDLIHEYHPQGIPVVPPAEDGTIPQIPTHIERPDAPPKPETDIADDWIIDDINWQIDAIVTQINANFGTVEERLDKLDNQVAVNIETFTSGVADANAKIVDVSGSVIEVDTKVSGLTEKVAIVENLVSTLGSTVGAISGVVNEIPVIKDKLETKFDKENIYTYEEFVEDMQGGVSMPAEEYDKIVPSQAVLEFSLQSVNARIDKVKTALEAITGTEEQDGVLVIMNNKIDANTEKASENALLIEENKTKIAEVTASVDALKTEVDSLKASVNGLGELALANSVKINDVVTTMLNYLTKMSETKTAEVTTTDSTVTALQALVTEAENTTDVE